MALGELAARIAGEHGGRVVKLLGDGVLMRFPWAGPAVDASLGLLDALPASGLPPGHAGVHAGPLIARDGDIFGRAVNLAARIGDAAAAGQLWATARVVASLGPGAQADLVGEIDLPGIGPMTLHRIHRGDTTGTGATGQGTCPT